MIRYPVFFRGMAWTLRPMRVFLEGLSAAFMLLDIMDHLLSSIRWSYICLCLMGDGVNDITPGLSSFFSLLPLQIASLPGAYRELQIPGPPVPSLPGAGSATLLLNS